MKISDNALREKLLEELKRKGALPTKSLTIFGNTWASDSKVREVLLGLKEENLVKTYKGDNSSVVYSLVGPEPKVVPEPKMPEVVNEELNKTLRHEFEIILRKQQRRRDFAARVLQNAEATIKHLEGLL
jgi:hypothetical protein